MIVVQSSNRMPSSAYFLLIVFCGAGLVDADKAKCCSRVSGNCKRACEQLVVLQEYPEDKIAERVTEFYHHCSSKNARHIDWCMSSSAQDTEVKWLDAAGKCCNVAKSDNCQLSCLDRNVGSRSVHRYCQDETEFFTCLQQHQVIGSCCGENTDSVQCQIACEKFLASTPTINRHAADRDIIDLCTGSASSTSLPSRHRCSRNFTTPRPSNRHNYLHCCKLAENAQCEKACQHGLSRELNSDADAIDILESRGCGSPSLDDRFWQCFLQTEKAEQRDSSGLAPMSQIENLGMDSVKLHCCDKATIAGCRKLCLKTFTNEWSTSWNDFDSECLSHPNEELLAKCLDDVEEPCDLGCDGLNYCAAFNNRPTELFRSCTPQTDDAAHYDVTLWRQHGSVTMFNYELPLKNITKCMPESWKAVACVMQIRPCTRQSHVNKICRDDCLELLSACLDWSNMSPGTSANALCARLSADPATGPCVPLRAFAGHAAQPRQALTATTAMTAMAQVTSPCKQNPCGAGTVCLVNRGCRVGGGRVGGGRGACSPYRCVVGCKAGEVSHYLLPEHSYARVPTFNGQKGCAKACQCTARGIERCQQLPCAHAQACWLAGRQVEHGSTFDMDCNTCNCFAGEITCTKKHCEQSQEANAASNRYQHTGLPCNCAPHNVPVCGSNGNTYPNSCLAKCAGLSDVDLKFGPCWSDDPCAANPCRSGEKCMPARQVCLSMLKKSCVQHKCVSDKDTCEDAPRNPVCATDNEEHPNLCHLLRAGKTLAYSGPCLNGCNSTGRVCGVDGNTYPSECAAFTESAIVDYAGPCISSGFVGHNGQPYCAADVAKCPKLPQQGCTGITPPGACCPKCAGALSILFSQKQVDRIMHTLQKRPSPVNALSARSVLGALDRHVQVAECTVRGYLTVYRDLLALVEPVVKNPSALQLEACVREAEKLATMLKTSSPRFTADLSLSTLLSATVVHELVTDGASSSSSSSSSSPAVTARVLRRRTACAGVDVVMVIVTILVVLQ